MHSEKSSSDQISSKKSFIEEARRKQIMEAAIDTIALHGYAQTSLAKIAEQAGISTSLILYHFKDKDQLMAEVLASIVEDWEKPAKEILQSTSLSYSQKLKEYIEVRLVHIGTRPKQSIALIELLFTSRPTGTAQAYRTEEQGFEIDDLIELLNEGQEKKEFGEFNTVHMAMLIRSIIDQFLGYSQVPDIDLETYTKDILAWINQLTSRG